MNREKNLKGTKIRKVKVSSFFLFLKDGDRWTNDTLKRALKTYTSAHCPPKSLHRPQWAPVAVNFERESFSSDSSWAPPNWPYGSCSTPFEWASGGKPDTRPRTRKTWSRPASSSPSTWSSTCYSYAVPTRTIRAGGKISGTYSSSHIRAWLPPFAHEFNAAGFCLLTP